ncbi:MAG: hypothetical protein J6S44_03590 [Clostridia bacterium]|nr:hypothetical protein [Clostridia bacterium]
MKYTPIAISPRTERTKKCYMGLTVPMTADSYNPPKYKCYRSGDRWMTLGYLRGFAKRAAASTNRMRTSYAEAEELYQSKPTIYDDELLLGHLYLPDFTEEEQAEYDALCESFSMSVHTLAMRSPRKDHICLNFEKLLRLGVNGLRAEIQEKMDALPYFAPNAYPALEAVKSWEFYQCCLIELDAVSDLARRYAEEALRLAEEKPEPRRSELIRLGNMLKKVPDHPAETFYEAVQSVQFFLSTLFGLYPLGRPDRYLYPFYKKDIENGTLTRELAQELVDNLCLYVSDRVFSRSACGFIVGGRDKDGNTIENDLTYMFLTALDHLKLPDPNGALAVTSDTSDEILSYAAEILSHGTSHPAFYNDDAITASLVKNYGVEPADAVEYIHATCAEISIAGKSKAHSTPIIIDLPKEFLKVTEAGGFSDFDELFDKYAKHLSQTTQNQAKSYAIRMLEGQRFGNEAMRICALIDDCVGRGKSIYEGGEKYMFEQPIFVGFSTVVDSLLAIRKLVYEEKKMSFEEFANIVGNDFEGNEPLRQYIINKAPHYGNDDPVADALAIRFADAVKGIFGENMMLWDHMMPGTFSYSNHARLGAELGATFDGRHAGTSYSDGCGPVQGRDVNGPTAMILSMTSWDQSALLGGMVVNIKFGKENMNERKREEFISLVRVFMERGGIELQVNVVDRATLLDAQRNPEAHKDLIVRIGGYSDYFTRISPVLQQEIIDRMEY